MLPFETLQDIWRYLDYESKQEFQKALKINSFLFEPKGVLRKFPFQIHKINKPDFVFNEMGGYLVWKLVITNNKYLEFIQTAHYGKSIWLYVNDEFPKQIWTHQETPPITMAWDLAR
jgi:hypothetical protein